MIGTRTLSNSSFFYEANNALDDSKEREIFYRAFVEQWHIFKGLTAPARPAEKSFKKLR